MAWEGDNYNDEYYVPIHTRLDGITVKRKRFGQQAAIAIGLLPCQCNALLQNSRPDSIKIIRNE